MHSENALEGFEYVEIIKQRPWIVGETDVRELKVSVTNSVDFMEILYRSLERVRLLAIMRDGDDG